VKIISNVFPMDGCRVIQCNIRDITERRQMGEQLRASEARYKRIAEGLTDYQYTVRVENGHAVATLQSQGCVTVTGYTPEDFAADPYLWIQLVAPEDRDRVKEHVQQILAGEHIPPIEYRINRKDGEDRWVSDTTILFKDASGNLQSYDGIIKDITERKTAEEQIQRYVAQLEDSFFRTVEVVTTLIEMRDPYTAGHERRVAELATAIGNELGLDARRIEGLRVAGQLHDIGKICLPAEILAKPGKITASEYTLIKEHSKAGYDVLKDVNFPWPVAEVAWQHHERMDGSGYPRGLKGDEILLEARIMSVADVVEAMASHRPYRPGLGIEAALGEIIGSRGTRYDPQVVDACVALFREQGYVFHN
jgi:PAS domain S-box-containing protein